MFIVTMNIGPLEVLMDNARGEKAKVCVHGRSKQSKQFSGHLHKRFSVFGISIEYQKFCINIYEDGA